ncbi:MAG TPA: DUF2344 domain-containing protein [Clostridiales bacterium]|jgi:radical SAM-linked protein|nr:DUF2344 domain-containing protein [Clostridiales bacterium]
MIKYRIVFEKKGRAKYISHLDLMRTFQRAFQRAGVKVRHTEGFNPRARISIAHPLPLGMESRCEILDFEALEPLDESLVSRLNAVMPEGIVIRELRENTRKASEIAWKRYNLRLIYDTGVPQGAAEAIARLFSSGNVVIRKKTKRGEADFNISPCINSLNVAQDGNDELLLDLVASAQSPSLNPMLIVDAIGKYLPEISPDFTRCVRVEMLDEELKPF